MELLKFLFLAMADTKKTRVRQFLKHGGISVNGKTSTQFNRMLRPGDEIRVTTSKKEEAPEPPLGVTILYEDEYLIAASKPAGLLTIATEFEKRQDALYAVNAYVNGARPELDARPPRAYDKKVFIVHRLDRGASGVVLFSKDFEVKNKLQKNWENFQKTYYAVVEGIPRKEEGEIRSYLREEKTLGVSVGPERPGSKLAITRYKLVEISEHEEYALLEVGLVTGRKHQIRAQLADIGLPIAGDKDYGCQTDPIGRMCLHAFRLKIEHPVTQKPLIFESPLPRAMKLRA